MSLAVPTTLQTDRSDATAVPDDPGQVFAELIERNRRVCRHCYRRLRRCEPYPNAQGYRHGDLLGYLEVRLPDSKFDLLDTEYFESVAIPDRIEEAHPPSDTAHEPTTACWNCGAVDHHRTPPTRSTEEAVRVACNVSVTLAEFGVSHDWLLLVHLVEKLKSRPSLAGDDFGVFGRAVSLAVDAVR